MRSAPPDAPLSIITQCHLYAWVEFASARQRAGVPRAACSPGRPRNRPTQETWQPKRPSRLHTSPGPGSPTRVRQSRPGRIASRQPAGCGAHAELGFSTAMGTASGTRRSMNSNSRWCAEVEMSLRRSGRAWGESASHWAAAGSGGARTGPPSGRPIAVTLALAVGVAALAACGTSGTTGSPSAGSPSASPSGSATGAPDPRCLPDAIRAVLQPSQAIVSSRCQVSANGSAYVAGIVRSGGQEQWFFAENAGTSWQSVSEQQLCTDAAGLAGVTSYCNGQRPDDRNLVLPTTKPPKSIGSPSTSVQPSNSTTNQ